MFGSDITDWKGLSHTCSWWSFMGLTPNQFQEQYDWHNRYDPFLRIINNCSNTWYVKQRYDLLWPVAYDQSRLSAAFGKDNSNVPAIFVILRNNQAVLWSRTESWSKSGRNLLPIYKHWLNLHFFWIFFLNRELIWYYS